MWRPGAGVRAHCSFMCSALGSEPFIHILPELPLATYRPVGSVGKKSRCYRITIRGATKLVEGSVTLPTATPYSYKGRRFSARANDMRSWAR